MTESESTVDQRSSDGWNRDTKGRFGQGNPGGPGASYIATKVCQLRGALLEAVTVEDVRAVALKLIEQAKEGDVRSAALLFDRVLGRVPEGVDLKLTVEGVSKPNFVVQPRRNKGVDEALQANGKEQGEK